MRVGRAKKEPPIELFRDPPRGMILSEGAGAALLAREGGVEIDVIDAGGNFLRRHEARKVVGQVLHRLAAEDACIVASANGTFVDLAERAAIEKELPPAGVYSPKAALGESVGASAMWQVIAAAQALRTRRFPDVSPPGGGRKAGAISFTRAIVLSCGLNQQVAGLRLSN